MKFGVGKLVLGLPAGEEIMQLAFFVLTQYRRVTDGQTDGQTRCDRYYPRKHSVARLKSLRSINEYLFVYQLYQCRVWESTDVGRRPRHAYEIN